MAGKLVIISDSNRWKNLFESEGNMELQGFLSV
jgi:hypothetical protein